MKKSFISALTILALTALASTSAIAKKQTSNPDNDDRRAPPTPVLIINNSKHVQPYLPSEYTVLTKEGVQCNENGIHDKSSLGYCYDIASNDGKDNFRFRHHRTIRQVFHVENGMMVLWWAADPKDKNAPPFVSPSAQKYASAGGHSAPTLAKEATKPEPDAAKDTAEAPKIDDPLKSLLGILKGKIR
jgi:hypothetical protein